MSDKSSVKVFARMPNPETGVSELVQVGTSHPGEVRLLRSSGFAGVEEGKIVLNLAAGGTPKKTADEKNADPQKALHFKQRELLDVGSISKEEVLRLLRWRFGLKERETFLRDWELTSKKGWGPEDIAEGRRSGRTTEIVLGAVAFALLEGGLVIFRSKYAQVSHSMARLAENYFHMAEQFFKLPELPVTFYSDTDQDPHPLSPKAKVFEDHQGPLASKTYENRTFKSAITSFQIDPNTLEKVDSPRYTEFYYPNATEWFAKLVELRTQGHDLMCADDPMNRALGYTDDNRQVHLLSLSKIKSATEKSFEPLSQIGITPEGAKDLLRTSYGRRVLFGKREKLVGLDSFDFSKNEDEDPNLDWLDEVCLEEELPVVEITEETSFFEVFFQNILHAKGKRPRVSYNGLQAPKEVLRYPQEPHPRSLSKNGYAPTLIEAPKYSLTDPRPPVGWTRFTYPYDKNRVPLVTAEGKEIEASFQGVFRRSGDSLLVIPKGGRVFQAFMTKWTLQGSLAEGFSEEELVELSKKVGGYIVPSGVSFADEGLDLMGQASLIT